MSDENNDALATSNDAAGSVAVERWQPSSMNETQAVLATIYKIALDPTASVDKLERLLELQERILNRQAKMDYTTALARLQPNLPTIDRNGQIVVYSKSDRDRPGGPAPDAKPQQVTPYALWEDINDAIRKPLADQGFALTFRTGQTPDGKITVTAILSHDHGHSEETTITLQHDATGSKNAVQAVGSSIAYGKRYTAGLLLNITSRARADRDDDGSAAGGPAVITDEQAMQLADLLAKTSTDLATFLEYFKAPSVAEMDATRFDEAKALLVRKLAKGAGK